MIQIKHQNVRILSSLMIIFNQIEINWILIETTSILYKYNLYNYKFQKNILILIGKLLFFTNLLHRLSIDYRHNKILWYRLIYPI